MEKEKTIIPLAKLLSDATEAISSKTGQAIAGLLNATFGNATELIISILALHAEEIKIVQSSMLGSIISNILLVLGTCFLAGGIKHKIQKFNQTVAQTSSNEEQDEEQSINIEEQDIDNEMQNKGQSIYIEKQYEEPQLPFLLSIILLIITTVFISLASEFLVNSFEGVVKTLGFTETFIGLIILPIVGNAAEAAKEFFKNNNNVGFIYKENVKSVIDSLKKGISKFAVVASKINCNGINKLINAKYIKSQNVEIFETITLNISHNLLSNFKLQDVETIYSHSEAFEECKNWLDINLKNANRISVCSTGEGAKQAAKTLRAASISSKECTVYGLIILNEDIQDDKDNSTEFSILRSSKNTIEI
ncbi:2052_t:CDS:2 [Racocetra persica]|uniref:2052_t:CDS:1 n=1 Tax=Racocetra persica TaxID=160502 RepID=A0ACA9K824_9GLOM|nr:2052_t:CDS:2 [Racocetra persica]